jgi:hypothetical protein
MPDYRDNRIGRLARNSHVIGGVIVELNDPWFHIRQVQAFDDGSFISLGRRYNPDGTVTEVEAEALVLGDIHAGALDIPAMEAWGDLFERTRPSKVVVHDLFDGLTVNPHDQVIDRAQKPKITVEVELAGLQELCLSLEAGFPDATIYAVASNHDHFLIRWLNAGQWVHDARNCYYAANLFRAAIEGKNPLSTVTTEAKNVVWMHPNDELTIGGFDCANHGDRGVGGSRGSLHSFKNTMPHVIGHLHSPGVSSNSLQVGCSCLLRQSYNKGLSNWLHASAVLYGQGKWEMVIAIEGKYTTFPKQDNTEKESV